MERTSGGDLRSAIAAGTNQQRNEKGQRNRRLQRFLKMLQHAAGIGFGDKEQQQPYRTFFPQRPRAGFQVGLFQRQRRPWR
jgi:hypothetical protein